MPFLELRTSKLRATRFTECREGRDRGVSGLGLTIDMVKQREAMWDHAACMLQIACYKHTVTAVN